MEIEEASIQEQAQRVKNLLPEDVQKRLHGLVQEGLVKEGDLDIQAMSSLVHLSPDLQDRVLTYIDNTKVYFMNARSKAGYVVSACDKARRGALDEKGIGAVDPWKDYLHSIARPQNRPIDLIPEAEWLQRFPDALEFIIGVPADERVQVSYIRLSLLLSHTIASVKKKLADIGIRIPIPKMRLREARVGFMADERTMAFYNLSGGKLQLLEKRRAGRRYSSRSQAEASERVLRR